jgi:ubiquinone/menaquinone biosynthesis C-methylase UbiE
MSHPPSGYIPAAGHDFLLPLYDPLLRFVGRETAWKTRLLEQAGLRAGQRVLDLGCGTGTLAVQIKRREPGVAMFGVDGDPRVLERARAKAARAAVDVELEQALADHLPYPDASFDRVLSSLVLHHLARDVKLGALQEVRRVLRPGGSFHLADFGPPVSAVGRLAARVALRGERLRDNLEGRLPELAREAGLEHVQRHGHLFTPFGTLVFLSASAPRA